MVLEKVKVHGGQGDEDPLIITAYSRVSYYTSYLFSHNVFLSAVVRGICLNDDHNSHQLHTQYLILDMNIAAK